MTDDSRTAEADENTPEAQHRFGLRLIALYKIVQALGLLFAAAAAFRLKRQHNVARLIDWLERLSLSEADSLRQHLIDALAGLAPQRFVVIGLVAIAYAALFLTEGVGLWLRRHWAEWFTVIATGSLIPLEGYELARDASWLKLGILVGNAVIVVYLARIAMQPHRKH
ncbi:MAG TPA: DUF2127 domain-containing protein [Dyella sp.]|nr:DUF2127 domain-containing protein [Dyella sp.]